jgi:tetratricopeptide (TPR) repeat protein
VDGWIEDGTRATDDDTWSLNSVRCSIEALNSHENLRAVLNSVIDVIEAAGKADPHTVTPRLMAYAQLLEYQAHWVLAADVYDTVLSHLHPRQAADTCVAAQLRLGKCYRNLNMLDAAAGAFNRASEIATSSGDLVGVLHARIGEARIAFVRGNIPQAERILDETIVRATGETLVDVRSRALHDRSNVAHRRGQYELAIRLAYDALEHSQSPTERDRILNDIATAFLELGVYSAARDAYLVLSAAGQEQYTRWTAAINLMEIASLTGVEPHFEAYRRELSTVALPPYLETAFQVNAGLGYQRFANIEKARQHLTRAVALATEHTMNHYLFEAEEALLQLETPTPPRRTSTQTSVEVFEVAEALRELRESVLV